MICEQWTGIFDPCIQLIMMVMEMHSRLKISKFKLYKPIEHKIPLDVLSERHKIKSKPEIITWNNLMEKNYKEYKKITSRSISRNKDSSIKDKKIVADLTPIFRTTREYLKKTQNNEVLTLREFNEVFFII